MKVADRVEVNPKIMMGKPVIQGTRIPVELIVRRISEGANERELLYAYPKLQKKDIKAALRYAHAVSGAIDQPQSPFRSRTTQDT